MVIGIIRKKISVFLHITFLSVLYLSCYSQKSSDIQFIENRGQWNKNIIFKLPMHGGDIYFEGGTTTFCLYDKSKYGLYKHGEIKDSIIFGHTYKMNLESFNPNFKVIKENPSKHYYNYFIGNDKSKWKGDVKAYQQVYLQDIYNGIDQIFYGYYNKTKYDFVVRPEGNPNNILISYQGVEKLKIVKGHLVIETSIGDVIEQSPYAYQIVDGKEMQVPCHFNLKNNQLSFDFPEGYNHSLNLVIDPVLSFSTYTGSTADNFGCTATNDLDGNMYVGGTSFGVGYPTTIGAFQINFAGGIVDMGISKFSADGTNLLYSTYIGGTGNEIPHSLVVNDLNELIILGTSNSNNYPLSASAFQNTMNGGTTTTFNGYGFNFTGGCDIVVTKLNASGNGLIGSTYVGGSGNDGMNEFAPLHYNYGDAFRGEVILGQSSEIIIASTTASNDFPVSANAPQPNNAGSTDAIIFALSTDLSTLLFSTYFGGTGFDSGYSAQINSNGDIYLCGGTMSADIPGSINGLNPNFLGGNTDGFVVHLNNNGSVFLASSYVGTSDYDQCFFVQTDFDDNVYLVGQTSGTYPILNAGYSNPNSGQFIQKLSSDLSTSLMSTTIGRSSGEVDISISAFLVSDCDFIYLSGWGGPLNGGFGGIATSSTTNNLPVTVDAFQSNTNGADFYLAVLAPDASALLYATFLGGNISAEHVDGGTSRFDKNGTVYQAVCAGCGGNSDFPTTPGVWSNTNNANNCNLGAFKFDLGSIVPNVSVPQPYVCLPSSYQFNNNSSGANSYFWDFGDGNTSTDIAPSHVYTDTGQYEVMMIAIDTLGCFINDTAYLDVDVFALDNAQVQSIDTICKGDSVLLIASGGVSYEWFPPLYLSDPNSNTTFAFPPTTVEYTVFTSDSCGTDTAQITVYVYDGGYQIMPDTIVCSGYPVQLYVNGSANNNWFPDPSIQNFGDQNPTAIPQSTTKYYVEVTTFDGCVYLDSVTITTINNLPTPNVSNDTIICLNDQIILSASGGNTYEWYPPNLIASSVGNTATTNIFSDGTIYVNVSNACGTVQDSVQIQIIDVYPQVSPDTTICPNDSALIWASGGSTYSWSPENSLSSPNSNQTYAFPETDTEYFVTVSNIDGCSKTLSTNVLLYSLPEVNILTNSFQNYGTEVQLNGQSNGISFLWETIDSVYCQDCLTTFTKPEQTSTYILHVTDENGCVNSDTITIYLDGVIYVPNTFTPNGDGINDFFEIKGKEIVTFNLLIFNRWGQLIFESDALNKQWDGTFKNSKVQQDAYIWKVEFTDNQKQIHKLIGHVNVLR